MDTSCGRRIVILCWSALACSGCTLVKPVACALVFPVHQFGERLDRSAPEEERHDELPAAAVIVAAPVLITLNYVYYTLYGAVGGLVSGFVSDLNLITGHGDIENSSRTLFEPLRTNAAP